MIRLIAVGMTGSESLAPRLVEPFDRFRRVTGITTKTKAAAQGNRLVAAYESTLAQSVRTPRSIRSRYRREASVSDSGSRIGRNNQAKQ